MFGIAALGVVHALVEPMFGVDTAKLAGAATFGIGLLFLVLSRAELFTENFFDPVPLRSIAVSANSCSSS